MPTNTKKNAESDPLVSVTICTYNGEKYLKKTLESIYSQTYKNLEIMIVDDGSTDGTRSIIDEAKAQDQRVRVYFQENKGLAEARNSAFRYAKGEWIAIIDQDDLCYPDRIRKQLGMSRENPTADFIFCNTHYINENDLTIGTHLSRFRLPPNFINKGVAANLLLQKGCYVDSESVFIKKSAVLKNGALDPSLRYTCDFDYFIKVGLSSNFAYTDEILGAWRIHQDQYTQKYKVKDRDRERLKVYFRYLWNSLVTWRTKLVLFLRIILTVVRFAVCSLRRG